MQSGFFTRVCGNLTIHPDLQMANWASVDHILYDDQYKWRKIKISDAQYKEAFINYKRKGEKNDND